MARLTKFLRQSKRNGLVCNDLDTEMVAGAMLDRISNQVQFAPWLKRNFGRDLSDATYKKRWYAANTDLFLRGVAR